MYDSYSGFFDDRNDSFSGLFGDSDDIYGTNRNKRDDYRPTVQRSPRNRDDCRAEALKYDTRGEFQNGSPYYYKRAWTMHWLNMICEHMPEKYIKWTYEACQSVAIQFNRRTDFKESYPSAYNRVRLKKWKDDIFKHMIEYKQIEKWTFKACQSVARKYKNRTEFKKATPYVYNKSSKKGWLDAICKHMSKRTIKWTLEACQAEALKYETRTQFQKGNSSAYKKATRKKWLKDICGHMPNNK